MIRRLTTHITFSFVCCAALLGQSVRAEELSPEPISPLPQAKTSNSAKLPFIRHSDNGWVRSSVPEGKQELVVCKVLGRKYSCLAEEKRKYSKELADVERVLLSGFN